jgi:hypothetical protein
MTDASFACSSSWFLVDSGEPRFTCDDLLQKVVTFAIMKQMLGTDALSMCAYAHLTPFMELKIILQHRIHKPNADIQLFSSFGYCHSSVLKNKFPSNWNYEHGGCILEVSSSIPHLHSGVAQSPCDMRNPATRSTKATAEMFEVRFSMHHGRGGVAQST